jgi:hypothetical protein
VDFDLNLALDLDSFSDRASLDNYVWSKSKTKSKSKYTFARQGATLDCLPLRKLGTACLRVFGDVDLGQSN